ncbi:hypothetical protein LSH36_240g02045 [Paralvinella palmiformis]|uniref:Uncharacterized protein n=1 Tax=Paralvinella palmiformis TaxID=53620 RepID=A0AAD9N5V5_9ANNE|nr:hypothetical protein LSH36_240g02045 [Paralvinella palmiformis]
MYCWKILPAIIESSDGDMGNRFNVGGAEWDAIDYHVTISSSEYDNEDKQHSSLLSDMDNSLCCEVVQITNDRDTEQNEMLLCREYTQVEPLFHQPCDSSIVGNYKRSASRHQNRFVAKQCRCTGLHKNQAPTETAAHAVYKQQLTAIGRRNQFMNRNRKPSESVAQYALALRELCGDFEYSAAIQSVMIDDDWCFTATFVHRVGLMGRATSKGNETK